MSPETLRKILEKIGSDIAWEVDFAGRGEPTIHPQFCEMVKLIGDCPVPACVVTTAVALKGDRLRAAAEHLDLVRISVSSIDRRIFSIVHAGLDYDQIWTNIREASRAIADKTVIHLTGGPTIYDRLPDTVAQLRRWGFSQFRLLTLWNRGGTFETHQDRERRKKLMAELEITPSENEAWEHVGRWVFFSRFARGRLFNRRYCPIGDASLSIGWDGSVLGCFQDFGHTSNVGNLDSIDLLSHIAKRWRSVGRMPICKGCDASEVSLITMARRNVINLGSLPEA